MSGILTAVIIVGIIGLVCGIALAIASIVLAVPVDEKAEAITEMLPGANCGACGFSGCAGYAAALSKGETTDTALCNPGGNEVSNDVVTEQITQDALDGELPDIIAAQSLNGRLADFDTVKMEVLCDLYEFMDKDDTLTREAFIPSVLNHIDYNFDGHAYLLPESFDLHLRNTAKTEHISGVEEWNLSTYMDLAENPPETLADGFESQHKTQWERLYVDNMDLIDFRNAECHFDSPDFIRALEYAYEGEPYDMTQQ